MESFDLRQALVDEGKVPLRRGDAALRFLLESVQNVDCFGIADGIYRTPRVAAVVRDDFKHGSSAKTSQWLGRRIGFALLSRVEGLADVAPDVTRELSQISSARTDPNDLALRSYHYTYIRLSVYLVKRTELLCERGER
jgi:hypothetical protein